MIQINTAPNQIWEVDYRAAHAITLNGEPFAWDIADLGAGRFHILHEGHSYNAEVVEADYATKSIILKINGQRVELSAKDRFDLLLERLGMSNGAAAKVNELKAPMPGLIVDIRVAVGQAVLKGDPLLVQAEQKLIDQADELVVLADSSKFRERSSLLLCPLTRIHTVITDDGIDDRAAQMLDAAEIRLIVVEPATDRRKRAEE